MLSFAAAKDKDEFRTVVYCCPGTTSFGRTCGTTTACVVVSAPASREKRSARLEQAEQAVCVRRLFFTDRSSAAYSIHDSKGDRAQF